MGTDIDYQWKIFWRNKGFRKVLRLLPPRSLDQGFDYFNSIVEINLASRMGDGVTRAYQQASSLSLMPVNLVGVAISNIALLCHTWSWPPVKYWRSPVKAAAVKALCWKS